MTFPWQFVWSSLDTSVSLILTLPWGMRRDWHSIDRVDINASGTRWLQANFGYNNPYRIIYHIIDPSHWHLRRNISKYLTPRKIHFCGVWFQILCAISKDTFGISHKILQPYITKYAFTESYKSLRFPISWNCDVISLSATTIVSTKSKSLVLRDTWLWMRAIF